MALVALEGLGKDYGALRAVDGVSLAVDGDLAGGRWTRTTRC